VPVSSRIVITVYNLLGQEVVRLVDAEHAPGRYAVGWHGENAAGRAVSSGVYLYRMTSSAGYTETRRMTLLR
jgi:flagellar hook assembly protein FlgD